MDLVNHESGSHQEYITEKCGYLNETISVNAKYNRKLFLCYQDLVNDARKPTNWSQFQMTTDGLCWTFFEMMHEVKFDSIEHMLIYVGALNSLFNPFIYAIWYSDFINVVKQIGGRTCLASEG